MEMMILPILGEFGKEIEEKRRGGEILADPERDCLTTTISSIINQIGALERICTHFIIQWCDQILPFHSMRVLAGFYDEENLRCRRRTTLTASRKTSEKKL